MIGREVTIYFHEPPEQGDNKAVIFADERSEYQRGFDEAKEMAALTCESVAKEESERTLGRPTSGEYQIGAGNCAAAIRALEPRP